MDMPCRPIVTVLTGAASVFLIPLLGPSTAPLPSFHWAINSPALADIPASSMAFRYIPPRRGIPKRTQGSGSRGCPQSIPVSLNLLVPNDHVGQTVSGRPTFFWYVSEPTSVPVEFALVESGVTQPLFVQQMEPQKAGIVKLAIPENVAELVPGRKYRWSVTLICNEERPSSDIFIQSWVKRVPATAELAQQLATVVSDRDRATIYARAGLWYDALAAISTAQTANPQDPAIHGNFISLLEQGGLNEGTALEH